MTMRNVCDSIVLRGCALMLALVSVSHSAYAQVEAKPPPVRDLVDDNGVDLTTGEMTSTYHGPSMGTPGAELAFVRQIRAGGFWESFLGAVMPQSGSVSVTADGVTAKFNESGGVYSSASGSGETLTFSGTTYTFTSRTGTVATFEQHTADYAYPSGALALLSAITRPHGERLAFDYASSSVCAVYVSPNCTSLGTAIRLISVTSNHGYKMSMSYVPHFPEAEVTELAFFFAPAQVTLTNLTNNATVGTLSLSYSWIQSNTFEMYLNDAAGGTTKYTINEPTGITSVRRPGSSADNVAVQYSFQNRVSSVTSDGMVTSYDFSDAGGVRTATVTNAEGGQRVVTSNISTGLILSDRDELNRTTSYVHDAQGRVTRVTAPEGNSAEHTYDARGNVTRTLLRAKPGTGLADIMLDSDFSSTCTNQKTCNQPNWRKDAKGYQTDFTYDPVHGGISTITMPAPTAGAVRPQVRYGYAALEAWYLNSASVLVPSGYPIHLLTNISTCRTLSSCTDTSDESRTLIDYGSAGVPNSRWPVINTSRDGSGAIVATTAFAYDSVGNVLTVDGPLPGANDITRTRYDALRRIVGIIGPDPDGAGPRPHVATRHTFNSARDLVTTDSGMVVSQADADWTNFAVSESVNSVYDAAGRRIKSSLVAGGTTYAVEQVSYDLVGRASCVATRMNPAVFGSLPASACTLGTTGSMGSDRIGKRTYDLAGHFTVVTTGYASGSAINQSTSTYTPNGKVATVADGNGNKTTYEYDGHDRLVKIRYPSPTTPGTSSTTDYEQFTHDANSNVISIRARNGQTIGLTVDNLDRLTAKDVPGSAEDVYLSYDNQNRMLGARFASPTGSGVIDTYDALGRMTSRSTFGRTLSYMHDSAGRRTRVTHPDAFYAEYQYNVADEPSVVVDSTGTTLASFGYDNLGRRTSIARANGTNSFYAYDLVSRLQTLTQDLAGTTYDGTATFIQSPAGQITSSTQTNDAMYTWTTGGNSLSMTHNGLNQLTQHGSTAVGHDTLGNVTTGDSAYEYGHDTEDRMRSAVLGATTVSMGYDPLGILNEVTNSGSSPSTFLYDGLDLIAEYSSSGNVLRRYIHGPGMDEPLVWYEGSGTADRRYFHADERSSIVAISNNSGAGTASFKYSPEGESTNAASSRFGYTGQAWFSQPGVYYYKSRMYSPKLGRFLQTDGIGYAGGMNLYAYASSDPINRVDPLGFSDCPPNVDPENCVKSTATRLPWDPSISGFDYHDIWALDDYEDSLSDPRNRPPVQARNPQTNNCGADGERRFPNAFGGKSFDTACATHDDCFATPGADFTACNKAFRRDIYSALNGQSNWVEKIVFRPHYKTTANAYFLGVQFGGRGAYQIAQYEAMAPYTPNATPAYGNMFTPSRIFGH